MSGDDDNGCDCTLSPWEAGCLDGCECVVGLTGSITSRPPRAEMRVAVESDVNRSSRVRLLRINSDDSDAEVDAVEDISLLFLKNDYAPLLEEALELTPPPQRQQILLSGQRPRKYLARSVTLEPWLSTLRDRCLPPRLQRPHMLFVSAVLQSYDCEYNYHDGDDWLVDWGILRSRHDAYVLVLWLGGVRRRLDGIPPEADQAAIRRLGCGMLLRASAIPRRPGHIGAARVNPHQEAYGRAHLLLLFFVKP